MSRGNLHLLTAALVALGVYALLAALLARKDRRETVRIEQLQRLAPAGGEVVSAPTADPELTAQRELACVDGILARILAEGTNVQAELKRCAEAADASRKEAALKE